MNSSNLNLIKMNSNLNVVFYNKMTSFYLFIINVNVTLSDLNDQLDQMNHHFNYHNSRRKVAIKYCCRPSTNMDVFNSLTHKFKITML